MTMTHLTNPDPVVAFARCPDYDASSVRAAVEEAIEALGGWAAFVKPGQRVLVKPNLLSDHPPEHAVTTHPEVVRAVLRALKGVGADPMVGDSPASAVTVPQIWEKTGFAAMCREEGVPLISFEGEGARHVERDGFSFTLSPALAKADVIVSVPKVKTHALTTLTCGVKNLYGCIPGYQKAALHKRHPRPADFGRLLQAIADEVRPALTLADGIVGMEGEGPSSGTPVALGFVAASADAYALDLRLCEVLGMPPRSVPYLQRSLSDTRYAAICQLGPTAAELRPKSFRIPSTVKARLVPRWVARLVAPLLWVRPTFDAALCIRCGRCVSSCPAHVLELAKPVPVLVRPAGCIGCCCCHEMCPVKAIHMRQSRVLRAYGAFRGL
jgi:uncharacterized protein (DUF362 family)/NAD-dependent dihydropyrimidine dehydrogenase PreA subunit